MAEVALGSSSLLGGMLSRSGHEDRRSCPTEAGDQVFCSLFPIRDKVLMERFVVRHQIPAGAQMFPLLQAYQ